LKDEGKIVLGDHLLLVIYKGKKYVFDSERKL